MSEQQKRRIRMHIKLASWCLGFACGAMLIGGLIGRVQAQSGGGCPGTASTFTCSIVNNGYWWMLNGGGGIGYQVGPNVAGTFCSGNGSSCGTPDSWPICGVNGAAIGSTLEVCCFECNGGGCACYDGSVCTGDCNFVAEDNEPGAGVTLEWVQVSGSCSGTGCQCCAPSVAPTSDGQQMAGVCKTGQCVGPNDGYSCNNSTKQCVQTPGSSQSFVDCQATCGGYDCQSGTCEFTYGGNLTLQQCEATCTGYQCQNNQCVHTGQGGLTLAGCQSVCGYYKCENGNCVLDVQNGTQSLAQCQADPSCGKYKCTNNGMGPCVLDQQNGTMTLTDCKEQCGGYECDFDEGTCHRHYDATTTQADCQASCHKGYSCTRDGPRSSCVPDPSSTATLSECKQSCQCAGECNWTFVAGTSPDAPGEIVWRVSGGVWVQERNTCRYGCSASAPGGVVPGEGIKATVVCQCSSDQYAGAWQLTSSSCEGAPLETTQKCGCDTPLVAGVIGQTAVTQCVGTLATNCTGTKTFHVPETDNNPAVDSDNDGDPNYMTIQVANGDRDKDGCCDFDETYAGLNDAKIGCCACSFMEEFNKAGGYVLTDRILVNMHGAHIALPGSRGASVGVMPEMAKELYWEFDFIPAAPDGTVWPKIPLWIPLTIENFFDHWVDISGQPRTLWVGDVIAAVNELRIYFRLAASMLVGIYCMGICFREVRV